MAVMNAKTAIYKPKPMPRSFSRVLGKLLALPVQDGIEVSRAVWTDSASDKQRFLAMQMRIRVLHNAVEKITYPDPVPEPEPEWVEKPENLIELTAVPVEDPTPEAEPQIEPEPKPEPEIMPEAKGKSGNLMSLDLEGDALNSMFAAMSGDDDDEDAP